MEVHDLIILARSTAPLPNLNSAHACMGLREVTACGLLCVLDDIFEHAGHGGDIRCNPAVFKRRFG